MSAEANPYAAAVRELFGEPRRKRARRTLQPTRPVSATSLSLRGIAGRLIAVIEDGEIIHHDPSAVAARARDVDQERERDRW